MAVTRGTKKWWIVHVAAGVAAVALLAFGMTQCSGKNAEREENEDKQAEVVEAGKKIDRATVVIDSLLVANRDLGADNRAKADTIRMQRDSIVTLNDSLAVVNEKLTDCRNSKRRPAVVKPTPTKPTPTKPVPIKPDTIIIVQQAPAQKRCGGVVNVSLNDSQNNGAIVANGAPCRTDIELNNGSVNNGAIVVGDGNSVVVNTPAAVIAADSLARARQIKNAQFTAVFYTKTK